MTISADSSVAFNGCSFYQIAAGTCVIQVRSKFQPSPILILVCDKRFAREVRLCLRASAHNFIYYRDFARSRSLATSRTLVDAFRR